MSNISIHLYNKWLAVNCQLSFFSIRVGSGPDANESWFCQIKRLVDVKCFHSPSQKLRVMPLKVLAVDGGFLQVFAISSLFLQPRYSAVSLI